MHTAQPRIGLIILLASVIAITPLAVDMYLPAMPVMALSMDAHISQIQQSLSIFLAAYASGMLLFGPLADRFGRRPLAMFGLSGFAIASLALTQVESIEWFLFWRSVQALCGSAATVVVPGIIRYLYQEHTARGMSYMSLIMMIAPLAAPAIGSVILWVGHWHGIFLLLAIYAITIAILCWRWLPEIKPEASNTPKPGFIESYATVFSRRHTRPLIATILFTSFSFFCFLTAVPFVYIQYFGANEQMFSVLFGLNVCLLMLANTINSRVVTRLGPEVMLKIGLGGAMIFATALCTVIFLEMGLWPAVLCIGPLMASLSLVSTNTDAMIIMQFPDHSGTATAVSGTLRFGAGALAGPLLAWCYTGTPVPFALLMSSGVVGVLCCRLWARRYRQHR